jgi:hypothetical protein
MQIINSWRSEAKQWGKWNIKFRLGRITLFDIYLDGQKKRWGITLFNVGIKNNTPKKCQSTSS